MNDLVDFSVVGNVGVITINNPPVNALAQAVRQGIQDGVNQGVADAAVEALVIVGGGRTFIAGADISEFGKPLAAPDLNSVLTSIEDSSKPVVAALHGTALGGGLEVALACHYRCAVAQGAVGLPEVKLGLLPGAGGTQRLPRLVGPEAAADMIISGNPVPAPKAAELGIVDEIVEGDLTAAAAAYAARLVAEKAPLRRIRDMDEKVARARGDEALFDGLRKKFSRQARGQPAPYACLESVRNAVELPFDEGMKKEREIFTGLMASPESAALRYAFFVEREANKIPDVPKGTPVREIKSAAIIGAGTMGGGIAMNFANAGIPVTLLEVTQEALDRGIGVISRNYASTVKRGRLSEAKMNERLALIQGVLSYDDIADADVVIEAAFEEMPIKKEIFAKLDAVCKPSAILASNTSTLDIDEMAAVTKRPGSVIGMHFFSPANVMRLLEVVRGAKTDKDVIATVMGLGKKIGKVSVLVGVCDGFVGNRMLHGYLREANFLLEEGALPAQIDRVIYDFGLPMGPFTMGDLAGLDIGWRIRKAKAASRPSNQRYSPLGDKLCELGRFGQKTGSGWYRYEEGNRAPIEDPEVEKIIVETSAELGMERREISDEEILARCIYPLINEGARILEEGMALRASDIDTIWINGYGFPSYRGGPMFYADQVGTKAVYDAIVKFADEQGPQFWEPAPLLAKLAAEGKGFLGR
jgi:3-hydroxyacyl-CoA dehydrogenase